MEQPLKIGSQLGQYFLEEQIGEGGAGAVYRARVATLNKMVALKVLLPSLTKNEQAVHRFKREAYSASQLNHPNIVSTYDFGQFRGVYYIVMPLLTEGNLAERLMNQGQFSIPEALSIALQIGQGVSAAHEQDIIHRDIKPENIVFHQGRALLTDFGLAFQDGMASITMAGARIGTPLYMSPEQAKGKTLDSQTDIYSLGVVLYEMVAGIPPFSLELSAPRVMACIIHGDSLSFKEVGVEAPADLEYIVQKAMKVSKKERYQTIGEFVEDLQKFSQGVAIEKSKNITISRKTYSSKKRVYSPSPSKQSSHLMVILLSTLLCGVGIGLLLMFLLSPSQHKQRRTKTHPKGPKIKPSVKPVILKPPVKPLSPQGPLFTTDSSHGENPPYKPPILKPPIQPVNPPLSRNDGRQWRVIWGGLWKMEGVFFVGSQKGLGPYGFSGLGLDRKIRNFQMVFEFQISQGVPGSYGGAFIGRDPNNLFMVYLCDSKGETARIPPKAMAQWKGAGKPKIIRLAIFRNGRWQSLRSQLIGLSSGSWVKMALSRQKGVLFIWVNQKKLNFSVKVGAQYSHLGFMKFFNTKMKVRNLNLRAN